MAVICIDGPNCSGKTTLINQIASKLNENFIEIIPDNILWSYVDLNTKSLTEFPFLDARIKIQEEYRLYEHSNRLIILDRWHVSFIVYDLYCETEKDYLEILNKYNILIPDKTYVLFEDINILSKRLKERIDDGNFTLKMPLREQLSKYEEVATYLKLQVLCSSNHETPNIIIKDIKELLGIK